VDATFGDDSHSGLSWGDAFATMMRARYAAEDDAAAGALPRILVAAGIYTGQAGADFPVILLGGYPPGGGPRDRAAYETVLDGVSFPGFVFAEGSAGSLMDGFTLRGSNDAALLIRDDVLVRNCIVRDNPEWGWGIDATAGRIERNQILRNAGGGIQAVTRWPCAKGVLVRGNLLEDNGGTGIYASDEGCLYRMGPGIVLEHNRILGTRSSTNEAVGLDLSCCPSVFNHEIVGTEGPGARLSGIDWDPPPWPPPGSPLRFATIAGSAGPAVRFLAPSAWLLTLDHAILWGNAGGDVESLPRAPVISYTLSEGPLAGTGNLSGADPLLLPGPNASAYLSQTAAGQPSDSPALDAGGLTAQEAGLEFRTTRTDGVRDQGVADLGFHAEPTTFSLFRGTDPAILPLHIPDIVLPVLDPGAALPSLPDLLYYRVDSDERILLRRAGADVEVRFQHQEYD
jgi:hypothetical protein